MTHNPFKQLLTLGIVSLFLLTGNTVHAQSAASCPSGSDNDCPSTQICNPDTKLCMPENNDNLFSVGDGPCSSDNECRGNTTQCSVTTHLCEYDPNATPPAGAGTPSTTGGSTGSGNFVSLTQLPTFQNITNQPSLTVFFNNLYKICIGIAATLALIQIIIAGVMYMGGDSVTETRVARQKIGQAILGLVLVLSPVVVFGIINPSILSLSIGGLNKLSPSTTPATPAPTSPTNPPSSIIQSTGQANPGCTPMPDGTVISGTGSNLNAQEQCCANQISATVSCQVAQNLSQGIEYCSCTTKK